MAVFTLCSTISILNHTKKIVHELLVSFRICHDLFELNFHSDVSFIKIHHQYIFSKYIQLNDLLRSRRSRNVFEKIFAVSQKGMFSLYTLNFVFHFVFVTIWLDPIFSMRRVIHCDSCSTYFFSNAYVPAHLLPILNTNASIY